MHSFAERNHNALADMRAFGFGPFVLQPERHLLKRNDEPVRLGSRALELLTMLVERPGEIVSKKELLERVWPETYVEECNLKVNMAALRRALRGETSADEYIATVVGRGYRFIVPVAAVEDGEPLPLPQLRPGSGGLPSQLSSVIGREREIDRISRALTERRLVSITGAAGIGKTSLAIASADRCWHERARTIVFVDLSYANDGNETEGAIARALSIADAEPLLATLCDRIGGDETLIVLDTCEHVVDAVAALAEAMLAACPSLNLLITSREALRIAGEWNFRLGPLPYPRPEETLTADTVMNFPAVSLLLDRAGLLDRVEMSEEDLPFAAEISRRLDGVPLALEFAAARVPDLGFREIAARLDDCFSIFTRGRRTALPRHQSLSAALQWSFGLLSEDELRALKHLAALPEPFTLTEAIATARARERDNLLEAVTGLFEKSFLYMERRTQAPRFRLPELTRTYMMTAIGAPNVLPKNSVDPACVQFGSRVP